MASAFKSVLDIAPDFERADEVCFCMGIIYKEQGDYQSALQFFERVVAAAAPPPPLSSADALYQIGLVHIQMGDTPTAEATFRRALQANPSHAKSLNQLGWSRHLAGDMAEALALLHQSVEVDGNDGQAWYLLGRVHMVRREYREAHEAYQKAVYSDSRNHVYWCSIGVLYFQMGQHKDALDAYTRAIRVTPNVGDVWLALGRLYETCNQPSDALDAYRRALDLSPGDTSISTRLELIQNYMETGGPPPALPEPPADGPLALSAMTPARTAVAFGPNGGPMPGTLSGGVPVPAAGFSALVQSQPSSAQADLAPVQSRIARSEGQPPAGVANRGDDSDRAPELHDPGMQPMPRQDLSRSNSLHGGGDRGSASANVQRGPGSAMGDDSDTAPSAAGRNHPFALGPIGPRRELGVPSPAPLPARHPPQLPHGMQALLGPTGREVVRPERQGLPRPDDTLAERPAERFPRSQPTDVRDLPIPDARRLPESVVDSEADKQPWQPNAAGLRRGSRSDLVDRSLPLPGARKPSRSEADVFGADDRSSPPARPDAKQKPDDRNRFVRRHRFPAEARDASDRAPAVARERSVEEKDNVRDQRRRDGGRDGASLKRGRSDGGRAREPSRHAEVGESHSSSSKSSPGRRPVAPPAQRTRYADVIPMDSAARTLPRLQALHPSLGRRAQPGTESESIAPPSTGAGFPSAAPPRPFKQQSETGTGSGRPGSRGPAASSALGPKVGRGVSRPAVDPVASTEGTARVDATVPERGRRVTTGTADDSMTSSQRSGLSALLLFGTGSRRAGRSSPRGPRSPPLKMATDAAPAPASEDEDEEDTPLMERQRQRHSKQQELGKQSMERRPPPVEPPASAVDLSAPDRSTSFVAKTLATGWLPSGASVKPVSPVHTRDNFSTRSGSGSPRRATASPPARRDSSDGAQGGESRRAVAAFAGSTASGPSAPMKSAPRSKVAVAETVKEKAPLPVKPSKAMKSGSAATDGSYGKATISGLAAADGPGGKTSFASKLAPPRRKSQSPASVPMKGSDKIAVKAADKHTVKAGDRVGVKTGDRAAAKTGEKTPVDVSGRASVEASEKPPNKLMHRGAVKVSDKSTVHAGSKSTVTAALNVPAKSTDKETPVAGAQMDDVPEPQAAPAVSPDPAMDAEKSPVHVEAAPSASQSPIVRPRAVSPLARPQSPEVEEHVEIQAASHSMEDLPSDAPILAASSGEGAVAVSGEAEDVAAVRGSPSPRCASAGRLESPSLRATEASSPPAVPSGSSPVAAVPPPIGATHMDVVPVAASKDASLSPPVARTSLPEAAPIHAVSSPPKRSLASSSPPKRSSAPFSPRKRSSAPSSPRKRPSASSSPSKRPSASSSPSKRPSALSSPSDRPSTSSPKGATAVALSPKKMSRSSVSPPVESGEAVLSADKMDTTSDEVAVRAVPAAKVALRPPVSPPRAVTDDDVAGDLVPDGPASPHSPPKPAASQLLEPLADAGSPGDKPSSKSRNFPVSPVDHEARTSSPRHDHSDGVPVQVNGRLDRGPSSPLGAHGGAASPKMTTSTDASAGAVANTASGEPMVPELDASASCKSTPEEPKVLEKIAASAAAPCSPGALDSPDAASTSPPPTQEPRAKSPEHETSMSAAACAVDRSQTEGAVSKPSGRRFNDVASISARVTASDEPGAVANTSRPSGRSATEGQLDDANATGVARSVEKALPAPPLPPLPPARKNVTSTLRPGRSPTGSKSALPIKTPSLLLGSSLISSSAAPATPIKRATPPPWWATATPSSGRSKGAGVKGSGLVIVPRSGETKDAADGDAVKLTAPAKGDGGKDSSSGGSSRPRLGSSSRATMAPPAPKAPLPSSSGGDGASERGQKRFRSGDGEASSKWRDAPVAKKRAGGHSDGGSALGDEIVAKDRPSDAAAGDSRSSPLSGSQRDAPSGIHKPSSPAVRASSPRSPRRDSRRDSDRGRDRDRDRGDRDGRFRYRGSDRPSHSSRRDRPRGERVSKGDQDP
ncbi:hypothetical protein MMPV_002354 [Pyropia vietnamensis]